MVEAVLSMLIVSVMLVAALYAIGASRTAENNVVKSSLGLHLAQDLMSEILQLPYQDPVAEGALGRDIGESAISRTRYNDVDDYNGWSARPPQYKDGSVIPQAESYNRSVEVYWVDQFDISQTSIVPTEVKRIDVTVKYNNTPVAALTAVRTSAWQSLSGSGVVAENSPPTAVAVGNPLSGLPPLMVTLFAGGSSDPEDDALTYHWDLGDGNTGSVEMLDYVYSNPGTYNLVLTVTDVAGNADTDTLTVVVKEPG
jgi:PKD repeat protein